MLKKIIDFWNKIKLKINHSCIFISKKEINRRMELIETKYLTLYAAFQLQKDLNNTTINCLSSQIKELTSKTGQYKSQTTRRVNNLSKLVTALISKADKLDHRIADAFNQLNDHLNEIETINDNIESLQEDIDSIEKPDKDILEKIEMKGDDAIRALQSRVVRMVEMEKDIRALVLTQQRLNNVVGC